MIDAFLESFRARLRGSRRARERILDEVRDHLDDAVRDLESRGVEPHSAQQEALRSFGPADTLARQFNAHTATTTMRRTPVVVGLSGLAVVGGFLLAAITQPQPAVPATAGLLVQGAFFVAMVGLQVATVAGARAASLVASRWRLSVACTADRNLVRDAAVICARALIVAAVGWEAALIGAIGKRPSARVGPLAAGMTVMVIGAVVASLVLRHSTWREGDESVEALGDSSVAVLDLGERVIGVVRHWPALTCFVVATVGALAAMSGAETTLLGALPSGVLEAAAVVAAFFVLGPRLGLRSVGGRPTHREGLRSSGG